MNPSLTGSREDERTALSSRAHGGAARAMGLLLLTLSVSFGRAAVEITVTDAENRRPVPCRIHLRDSSGGARPAGVQPFFRDHFVCPGAVQLDLPAGRYAVEIERGPEYSAATAVLAVTNGSDQKFNFELKRLANMPSEGWWSGDLHVHRPLDHIELLMQAEDLHIAPVITWWNNQNRWRTNAPPAELLRRFDGNRFYHAMAGEDEREGGALLYFHLNEPLPIAGAKREYPSPARFLAEARKHSQVWVDIEKPFWWDAPIWLAGGQVDSIGLANNHMCRNQMYESEAWGKPRDPHRLPAPRGNGFWTQEIYYHILNCGLRIPPSAGSASGVLPNPVGYNRVYVHVGDRLTYESWWEGLRAGRSFVSNGPLLRCRANGQWPGHVFRAAAGGKLDIGIEAALSSRDPIAAIEVIKDGRVERTVPFDEWQTTGRLGNIQFAESGWFLVRTMVENPKTFRFASTAPYFVEIGEAKNRISKASAQFFVDWVVERQERVKHDDAAERAEVLRYHVEAEKFWRELLARANAD